MEPGQLFYGQDERGFPETQCGEGLVCSKHFYGICEVEGHLGDTWLK